MVRILKALATAVLVGSATVPGAHAQRFDRLAAIRLIEHAFLREDPRVFGNREGGATIEASLVVAGVRYDRSLQRPSRHEFLLVIDARDGARCPGQQTIIVGTTSGAIYQGICQANIALNLRAQRTYYEAELDRLLRLFYPLLAPQAPPRPAAS